jgi:hypothetical protein
VEQVIRNFVLYSGLCEGAEQMNSMVKIVLAMMALGFGACEGSPSKDKSMQPMTASEPMNGGVKMAPADRVGGDKMAPAGHMGGDDKMAPADHMGNGDKMAPADRMGGGDKMAPTDHMGDKDKMGH